VTEIYTTILRSGPLNDVTSRYFCLDGVRTAAHDLAVIYDATGRRYGRGTGLMLLVDGVVVASSPTLSKLSVTFADGPLTPPLPTPPSPKPPPPPPSPPSPPAPPVKGARPMIDSS
jgi:hypothetical protein